MPVDDPSRPRTPEPLWPGTAPAPDGLSSEERPAFTKYLLPGDGPRGCAIVLPGSGYGDKAPHEGEPVAL